MHTNDAGATGGADLNPERGAPAGTPPAAEDENQSWLGCEGLHPLTWLPAPETPLAQVVTDN